MMKTLAIGNDLKITWSINVSDGQLVVGTEDKETLPTPQPYPLEGKDITLFMTGAEGVVPIEEYEVKDNTLSWTFHGCDQIALGVYTFVVIVNDGKEDMHTFVSERALRLVKGRYVASDLMNLDDTYILGIKGDRGFSAYEIAVKDGYEGTEAEWLQSLKQPALDAALIASQATKACNIATAETIAKTKEIDLTMSNIEMTFKDIETFTNDAITDCEACGGRAWAAAEDARKATEASIAQTAKAKEATDNAVQAVIEGTQGIADALLYNKEATDACIAETAKASTATQASIAQTTLAKIATDASTEQTALAKVATDKTNEAISNAKVATTNANNATYECMTATEEAVATTADCKATTEASKTAVSEAVTECDTATEASKTQTATADAAEQVRQEQEEYRETKQADMEVAIRNKQDIFAAGKGLYFTPAEESMESKYVINTYYGNATIGATISLTPSSTTTDKDMGTYLVQVSKGDKFRVSGTGGNNWRLWAWLDSSRKVISNSAANITVIDLELIAGQNGYLTINARPSTFHSLRQVLSDANEETLRLSDSILERNKIQEAIQDDLMALAMHPTDVASWATRTNLENLFSYSNTASQWQQKRLWTIAPSIYTDNEVTNMISTFYGQSSISSIDISNINLINCTSYYFTFNRCTALAEIKGALCPDRNKKVDAWEMCDGCSALTYINLGEMTPSRFASTFRGCSALVRVDGVMYLTDGVKLSDANFNSCTSLRYLNLHSIGIDSTELAVNLNMPCWGDNSEDVTDAYDSVVYSLIDNIYDRASNGLDNCTISLSTTTKGLLSDAQKASIVAKGFTIA